MQLTDDLERLQALHANGALTDSQFEQAKAKLLAEAARELAAPLIAEIVADDNRHTTPTAAEPYRAAQPTTVENPLAFLDGPGPDGLPLISRRPLPSNEVTGKDITTALKFGAIGGGVIAMAANFALTLSGAGHTSSMDADISYWASLMAGVITGVLLWTPLALAVKMTSRSQGFGASLLRLLHHGVLIAYVLSVVFVFGVIIYFKAFATEPQPAEYFPTSHATFGSGSSNPSDSDDR